MVLLTNNQQATTIGGFNWNAITVIGVISCSAALVGGAVGALIAGPTCGGMLLASVLR